MNRILQRVTATFTIAIHGIYCCFKSRFSFHVSALSHMLSQYIRQVKNKKRISVRVLRIVILLRSYSIFSRDVTMQRHSHLSLKRQNKHIRLVKDASSVRNRFRNFCIVNLHCWCLLNKNKFIYYVYMYILYVFHDDIDT